MKLVKYVFWDIARNKILIGYAMFLFAVSFGLFSFSDDPIKATSSLLNIVLIVLPLFSVIFATSYYYNAYEFTTLVLGQPINRLHLFFCQFAGVCIAMTLAFIMGCGIPIIMYMPNIIGIMLLLSGISLTLVFISLAFMAGVLARDKARGIGIALLLWFYFAFLYDALVLMLLFAFSDYPMENTMMTLAFLNPVDLIRILMLMQLDMAAIMGYTGAVFNKLLGSSSGTILCFAAILVWIALPLTISALRFRRKDI